MTLQQDLYPTNRINLFWFRRDLRLNDNCGLYHALKDGGNVLGLFIFDKYILDKLEDKDDSRVHFIYTQIVLLKKQLEELGSSLIVRYGHPEEVFSSLIPEFTFQSVFLNRDWEPYALSRDQRVQSLLKKQNIPTYSFKDHLIFEKNEVLKPDGSPYTVFTPYARKWKMELQHDTKNVFQAFPSEKYRDKWALTISTPMPSIEDIGFQSSHLSFPGMDVSNELIIEYALKRNYPAIKGTSKLGVHFRFGTISIREIARKAFNLSETFLNELIWRDFYAMILAHFPYVAERSFRPEYDNIEWRNHELEYQQWCEGKTGYPLVDAGMRELNATGFMHNRLRMITASFLTKHLLIDWRLGEAWFARKLLDFDLASNNGGWQWAAGCGTDAAPYFRIFNPAIQLKKFDPHYQYVKKWIPEWGSDQYPNPIVDHNEARERCLMVYKQALNRKLL